MQATEMRTYRGERTVCAPRAEILEDGIPYVAGWAAADRATRSLAESIRSVGLDVGFAGLRSDVSVHGDGMVCLGTVPADVVQRLADLLARGLCAELEREGGEPAAA
ncbi:hypothetical protein [Phaeacidiphilus oryzae]|uniref:hypothetical protein n=1 Tax=Phaeacidiphilus oryzae TaxID=348818 RepID=UPI000A88F89B|nr:hypothetical protein [Phaeacidiphilus oryzae]